MQCRLSYSGELQWYATYKRGSSLHHCTPNKHCSPVLIISRLTACRAIGFHTFHSTDINTSPLHFSLRYNNYAYIAKTLRKNRISYSNRRTCYNTITTTTSGTASEQHSSQPHQLFPLVYVHRVSVEGNTCLHKRMGQILHFCVTIGANNWTLLTE